MDRANKVMTFVLCFFGLIDIILRYTETPNLSLLTTMILPLNILEILIALIFIVLVYRFLPNNLSRIKYRIRAEYFWKNWKTFKELLNTYSNTNDKKSQCEYKRLREKLELDFNFFVSPMKSVQEASHRKEIVWYIDRLEECFRARNIDDWESKSGHKISDGIDYLDYLIIALKEDAKKPIRKGN